VRCCHASPARTQAASVSSVDVSKPISGPAASAWASRSHLAPDADPRITRGPDASQAITSRPLPHGRESSTIAGCCPGPPGSRQPWTAHAEPEHADVTADEAAGWREWRLSAGRASRWLEFRPGLDWLPAADRAQLERV